MYKIIIPAKKMQHATDGKNRCLVRLSVEAYNTIVDIYNESSMSMSQVTSTIIMQAKDHIVFEKED